MSKQLVSPAGKTASGQRKPKATKATRPAAKRSRKPATGPAEPPGDPSEPPVGLYGASESDISDIEMETERLGDSEETLPELERELGMADWIDPQTGEPAEGQSPPHLENE